MYDIFLKTRFGKHDYNRVLEPFVRLTNTIQNRTYILPIPKLYLAYREYPFGNRASVSYELQMLRRICSVVVVIVELVYFLYKPSLEGLGLSATILVALREFLRNYFPQ